MNNFLKLKHYMLLTIGMLFLLSVTSCSKINSAETLFSEISKRYNGTWYSNIKYMISVVKVNDDGSENRITCSAEYVRPEQYIIKKSIGNNDGYLYKNDTIYEFKDGELVSKKQGANDLIFVVMDIYGMSSNEIISKIKETNLVDISEFCSYTDTSTKKEFYIGD